MDESQSDIYLEVLRRLDKAGVLSKIIVIGGWCLPIYRDHYFIGQELTVLRTRDLDLLVPRRTTFPPGIDVPGTLEDMGFVLDHSYPEGHARLFHPELIIEFLVPDVGRGSSEP